MILVLDFGSQYTQLIARRVREAHVYCEIHPFTLPLERITALQPAGIILSGGPSSVYEEGAPLPDTRDPRRSASRCSASATACTCSTSSAGGEVGARAAPRVRRRPS